MTDQILLCLIAIASIIALLVTCPSPAKFWESIENYAGDRKHARLLIDGRQAARRNTVKVIPPTTEAPALISSKAADGTDSKGLFA